MLKIFLTGITGYIGGSFFNSLNLVEYEVYALIRKKQKKENNLIGVNPVFYEGNAAQLNKILIDINPDFIIHFAGYVNSSDEINSIDDLIESNIKLPNQIFFSLKNLNVKKVIIASTHWQNYKVQNLYTKTKQMQEELLRFYSEKYSVQGISIRIPDVFGPNDPRSKIWNAIIDSINNKTLLKMSEGNQEIDLLYINDVVSAFKIAMELDGNSTNFFNVYNISSSNIMSLKNIIAYFEFAYKSKSNIHFGAKPYRENEIMHLKHELNILPKWKPNFNLEKSINDLIKKQEPDTIY